MPGERAHLELGWRRSGPQERGRREGQRGQMGRAWSRILFRMGSETTRSPAKGTEDQSWLRVLGGTRQGLVCWPRPRRAGRYHSHSLADLRNLGGAVICALGTERGPSESLRKEQSRKRDTVQGKNPESRVATEPLCDHGSVT